MARLLRQCIRQLPRHLAKGFSGFGVSGVYLRHHVAAITTRLLLQPVARRWLPAVAAVQPEPPLQFGDPCPQYRHLGLQRLHLGRMTCFLRQQQRNEVVLRELGQRGAIHRILESTTPPLVKRNLWRRHRHSFRNLRPHPDPVDRTRGRRRRWGSARRPGRTWAVTQNQRSSEPRNRRGNHQACPHTPAADLVTTFYTYPHPTPSAWRGCRTAGLPPSRA